MIKRKFTKLMWKNPAIYGIMAMLRMGWLPERGST